MATSQQQLTLANGDAGSIRGLLELVLDSLPGGLVVFDRDLNIILTNGPAKRLLPDEKDISQAVSRLAVESTYEDWGAELRKVMATGKPQRFDVTVQGGGDGPDLYLNLVVNPLRAPDAGEACGGLLLVEDISSRIGMERRLAVSERLAAVGKLAARVAHELNNPLDGILRYTNLAIRRLDGAGDPKLEQYIKNVKSGVIRMGEIITALLEFSRTTPGTFEQATINKIVEDAITAMEGRARAANVTIVCNFHQTDMPVVRGSNIFQVFCNIVKNAIDAMPDEGTLTITTGIAGPDVVVRFEDTGVGLPAEIDKIFEPFFTTKDPGKGTGLGLAVCKELIERYGGTITAERRQPRGTTVTVRIPVRNCAALPPHKLLKRPLKDGLDNRSNHHPDQPASRDTPQDQMNADDCPTKPDDQASRANS